VFFETIEELRGQVGYWLPRELERSRIAQAGLRRVQTETYADRARTILDLLGD
jgi:hypothetical protein